MNLSNVGLHVSQEDNVATVFGDIKKTDLVEIIDKKGEKNTLESLADIPYGHKIAVYEIKKGTDIIKYGSSIGMATENIKVGDYVHIHNVVSNRGRGDLERGNHEV